MRLNEGGFVAYQGKGAATALYISATKGKQRKTGWVSSGSYLFPISGVSLGNNLEVVMPTREPKENDVPRSKATPYCAVGFKWSRA